MSLVATLIYWVIIAIWVAVLTTVGVSFARNPRMFGRTRLLLSVVLIDTTRNIVENLYFGFYFGGQYGVFPASVARVLGDPVYLIMPKVMNVVAGSAVLGILLLRWLPAASKERADAEAHLKKKEDALAQEIEQRRHLTLFDPLTGLPNRVSLQMDLARKFGPETREHVFGLTLATLDLDQFKDINDTLGHPIGDKLLQQVAARLKPTSEETRVYRLGDDEFVVIFERCTDPLVASGLVDDLLQKVGAKYDLDGSPIFVTASAGLAIAPVHGFTLDDLLSNAELALFDAKAAGGRCQRLFFPALRARAQNRRELDNELRRAFANGEFVLHFQPQVRSGDYAVVGAEALIRWQHPARGVLGPSAFIDALAESAVAIETGRWILDSACAVAASWRTAGLGNIRISVNLFPAQFRGGSLEQDVESALAKSGLPAENLELEITENIALASDELTLSALKRLRAKGVGIAFDDFGTGFASLSYLTRYPLSELKIDRSFIQNIGTRHSDRDEAIVRSIIAMARNLRLHVVAEGVETRRQAELLRDEGCHTLQGFLFSKPLPSEAFADYVRSSRNDALAGGSHRLVG